MLRASYPRHIVDSLPEAHPQFVFQIVGRDVLFGWLGKESDPQRRLAMLEWLATFAEDPLATAHRVPGVRAPVFIVVVPLNPSPVLIRFLYADQYHCVKLIHFGPLP